MTQGTQCRVSVVVFRYLRYAVQGVGFRGWSIYLNVYVNICIYVYTYIYVNICMYIHVYTLGLEQGTTHAGAAARRAMRFDDFAPLTRAPVGVCIHLHIYMIIYMYI